MIPLATSGRPSPALARTVLGRVTRIPVARAERADSIWAGTAAPQDPDDYAGILLEGRGAVGNEARIAAPVIDGIARLDHLADDDVVAMNPSGYVRTLYRAVSRHNAIFTTDRCNSYCLMCSQPPKDVDDSDLIGQHLRLVDLIRHPPAELGITGGEPTLLKDDLVRLIQRCKERLPTTTLHVLSNGRLFHYGSFARAVAGVEHPNLMFGIPVYSDIDHVHDHVVQCRGAFDETAVGLQNLARFGVAVEIRVVLHRFTYARLPQLARFLYRNFPFAAQVAFMGLEPIGFAVANMDELWIDPWEYREPLEDAVRFLDARGLRVSVYNLQLCVLPQALHSFAVKSISDWKNEYLPMCSGCTARDECGGFFASALKGRISTHIQPLQ